MSTINGIPYSSPRNVNLKGVSTTKGSVLRFDKTSSSNPLDSSSNGLYVNASNQLIFSSQGTTTVIGVAGGGSVAPSLDAIFQGDQTLDLGALSTLTIDRSSGNNDVLTLTNTGAGSGDTLQITNVGTGKDVNGTNGTWSFSKTGQGVAKDLTIAGTAGSNSITLTAGDVVFSDASLTITDADNAATVSVTNNTATTASVIAIAGSGAFTGSTTTSFMTLTASGLTTGTALYIPVAALTQGKAVHVVANAITTGVAVHIASSVASTTLTTTGRLFKVDHTGNATGTGILSEFNSAAADETVIVKVTASAALALGTAFQVSASSMTTGSAITAADLDALTTGKGVHIASAATAITTTGRMFLSDHTGVTGTSATLNEFKTAAADETILVALTANDMATGTMLTFGTNIALTTGTIIKAAHTTSVIADGGSMLRLSSTGINTGGATNGTMIDVKTTAQVAGTQVLFQAGAMTTGVLLSLVSTTGLTSGSLLRATTSTAGAIATNGAISLRATGAFTSTSNVGFVDVLASATTAGTVVRIASSAAGQTATELLRVHASGFTTGYTGNVVNIISTSTTGASNALLVTTDASTAGTGIKVVANSLTTGTGLLVTSSGTITSAGEGLVNIVGTGITSGSALKIDLTEGTLNGGFYLQCYDDTGAGNVLTIGEDGAINSSGGGTFTTAGAVVFSGTETIAAGGTSTALSLTKTVHYVDADAGGDTFTLADGTAGQVMTILMKSATGTATVTPANLAGGTSVTFNAAGDSVVLQFMDTDWYIIGGNSYSVS